MVAAPPAGSYLPRLELNRPCRSGAADSGDDGCLGAGPAIDDGGGDEGHLPVLREMAGEVFSAHDGGGSGCSVQAGSRGTSCGRSADAVSRARAPGAAGPPPGRREPPAPRLVDSPPST